MPHEQKIGASRATVGRTNEIQISWKLSPLIADSFPDLRQSLNQLDVISECFSIQCRKT